MTTKTCTRCHTTHPLAMFNRCRSNPDHLDVWCRNCRREIWAEYSKKKRAEHDEAVKRYTPRQVKAAASCSICTHVLLCRELLKTHRPLPCQNTLPEDDQLAEVYLDQPPTLIPFGYYNNQTE